MPYFLPASSLFLSAIFLETTPLSFRYHSVTSVLPSSTFPVPCYLSSTSSAATYQLQAHSADLQRSELLPVTRRLSTARR